MDLDRVYIWSRTRDQRGIKDKCKREGDQDQIPGSDPPDPPDPRQARILLGITLLVILVSKQFATFLHNYFLNTNCKNDECWICTRYNDVMTASDCVWPSTAWAIPPQDGEKGRGGADILVSRRKAQPNILPNKRIEYWTVSK